MPLQAKQTYSAKKTSTGSTNTFYCRVDTSNKQTNKHHRSVLPAARLRVRTLCRQGRIRKVFPHSYSLRQTRQDTCNKKKQPTTTSRGTRQVKYRRTRPQPSRPSSRYRRSSIKIEAYLRFFSSTSSTYILAHHFIAKSTTPKCVYTYIYTSILYKIACQRWEVLRVTYHQRAKTQSLQTTDPSPVSPCRRPRVPPPEASGNLP